MPSNAAERRAGGVCLVVFSGELDKLMAAFVMATGAAASGLPVHMFFTFWATHGLRRSRGAGSGRSLTERALCWMIPAGWRRRRLSHLHWGGLGRRMLRREMRRKGVADLPTLVELAARLGVSINVCEMSMDLMGIQREDLIDYPGLSVCGVAGFLQRSTVATNTLFI